MRTTTREKTEDKNSKEIGQMGELDYSESNHGEDERVLSAVSHVSGLFGWIVGPLIIYLFSKDDFVRENAGQAFSWQINVTMYLVVSFILSSLGLGPIMVAIFVVFNIWFCLVASLKSFAGKSWEYPMSRNYLSK